MVDKESYDTCSVKNISGPHHNREVLRCDQDPKTFKYTEEIFAMYRAFTDKVKYTFGKDYYFICKLICEVSVLQLMLIFNMQFCFSNKMQFLSKNYCSTSAILNKLIQLATKFKTNIESWCCDSVP